LPIANNRHICEASRIKAGKAGEISWGARFASPTPHAVACRQSRRALGRKLNTYSTQRSPRVNSIIYIVGLVVVVVAVLSFFGLR
jgi:hypothetical protein